MPLAEGNWEKMGESLVSGKALPGSDFISHMAQADSRRPPRTLYPLERLCDRIARGLHQWTAMETWTGPMVSHQQGNLGRRGGIKTTVL